MRLIVLCLLALIFTGVSSAAPRSTPQPELDKVASLIAGQDLTVRCWVNDGTDPDSDPYAWGYVNLFDTIVYLDPAPCAGALAVARGEMVPLPLIGLGALVLTHESYHLKLALPEWRRGNEAQTECRAIKRVPQTLLDLGASQVLADAALPWAIAVHFKISTFPNYGYPSCRVPVFTDFWP